MAYNFTGACLYDVSLAAATWSSDFTVACRCNITGSGVLGSCRSSISAGWSIICNGPGVTYQFGYRGVANYNAGTFPTGWGSIVVCKGSSDFDSVINGVNTNVSTAGGGMTPPNTDGYAISANGLDAGLGTFPITAGVICEWAFWNARLSVAEAQAFAKGYSPLVIRRSALIRYHPLSTNWNDLINSAALATTGSPTPSVTAHGAVIYPRRNRTIFVPAAAGSSFQAAWARRSNQMLSGGYFA